MTDASPVSNISISSDEEDRVSRRPPITPTPSNSSTPAKPQSQGPPQSDLEKQLMDLLAQAADEIRSERAKVADLKGEVARLKEQNKSNAGAAARSGNTTPRSGGDMPVMVLKQKLQELALENYVAVHQISDLRLKISEMQGTIEDQHKALVGEPRGRASAAVAAPVAVASSAGAAAPSPATSTPPRHMLPTASTPRQAAPRGVPQNTAKRAESAERLPPRTHRFDPMASAKRAHSPPKRETPEQLDEQRRNYNEVMMNRLRRAIAPPPTKEQLGQIVHAMLSELIKQLEKHGARLTMKRLDHGVYQCGKRKLHLTVDSNRLVVKAGGGHVDLLEHIERNKLCTRIE